MYYTKQQDNKYCFILLQNLLEKNRWLKYKHLLWIWFIINPERLIATMEQLRDFVNEQARNSA